MKIIDYTDNLKLKETDFIASRLLTIYEKENGKYPDGKLQVVIRPLGETAYEADLMQNGDVIISSKYSGKKLHALDVKLPPRDLNEHNIV